MLNEDLTPFLKALGLECKKCVFKVFMSDTLLSGVPMNKRKFNSDQTNNDDDNNHAVLAHNSSSSTTQTVATNDDRESQRLKKTKNSDPIIEYLTEVKLALSVFEAQAANLDALQPLTEELHFEREQLHRAMAV